MSVRPAFDDIYMELAAFTLHKKTRGCRAYQGHSNHLYRVQWPAQWHA